MVFVFGGLLVGSSFDVSDMPQTSEFIDRHWRSLKMNLARSTLKFQPSSQVYLKSYDYTHTIDFWSDEMAKKEIMSLAQDHKGPIISNLHADRLRGDPVLSGLLDLTNYIRPFDVQVIQVGRIPVETFEFLGKNIEAKTFSGGGLGKLSHLRSYRILPEEPTYYQEGLSYGYLDLQVDLAAQFVSSYPLVQRLRLIYGGALQEYPIPSPVMGALQMLYQCETYSYSLNSTLRFGNCQNGRSKNLDLDMTESIEPYFYTKSLFPKQKDQDQILIISVNSPNAALRNLLGERVYWGEILATTLSNVIESHTPKRPPWLKFWEFLVFGFLLVWLFIGAQFYKTKGTGTVVVASVFALILLDLVLTLFFNYRTHFTDKTIVLCLAGVVAVGTRALLDFDERNIIERALAGYVSEDRLDRLLKGKAKLNLDGQKREMTTMLVDIKGFSKLSHDLGARGIFEFSRRFFSLVDPVVFKFGGTIDKKTGDGFLAFFGDFEGEDDPHLAARQAIRCAEAIQKRLHSQQEKKPDIFGVKDRVVCRVGINSGPVMIGNTGSKRHFNYTVLGDTVNFTQRLEAACSPEKVMVGVHTKELTGDEFKFIERQITVKNEDHLFTAFELVSSV